MSKIKYLIIKEFRQIRRDRAMIGILIVMPILQLLLLGYVVSSDVRNIRTVICDLDKSSLSRSLSDKIIHSPYFNVRAVEPTRTNTQQLLDSGEASVVVVFPADFSHNIIRGQKAQIQILVDGQDVNTATIALGYLNGIFENFAVLEIVALGAAIDPEAMPKTIEPNFRIWYNEELQNSDYMVPGIAVFLLTMITSVISSMGLVREREVGTLEQLLVAPIRKTELIIGKIIPFGIIGLFELALAIGFAKLWYDIPIIGNLFLFFILSIIYLFTTLGIGLMVSASAHTQQQAMFMSWFLMIFIFLMSGFLFPLDNMPKPALMLTYLNPLRYYIIVVRELFLKGAGLRHLYPQGLALILFGSVIFSGAVWRFQNRIK